MRWYSSPSLYQEDWFVELDIKHKALWSFICTHANVAGIWTPNFKTATMILKNKFSDKDLEEFGNKIRRLPSGRILIEGFAFEQFGKITSNNGVHKSILGILETEGLTINDLTCIPPQGYAYTPQGGLRSPREGEGEGVTKKGEYEGKTNHNGNGWHPSEFQIRLNRLFRRRETTVWNKDEMTAYRKVEGSITEEDLNLLDEYYARAWPAGADYRKRKLITLLNDWNGELDKVRASQIQPVFVRD